MDSQQTNFTDEERQAIEEGKKHFHLYNLEHHKRGLKFHPEKENVQLALASFPRSGSSLLLNMIENITGFFGGEDMPIEVSQESIASGNVRGTIDYVKIVRTHWPWLAKEPWRIKRDITCNKAVVLIRNPFKCFVSLYGLLILGTHKENLPKEEYAKREKDFDSFIRVVAEAFNYFCNYWYTQKDIPSIFITYETMMSDPNKVFEDLFTFIEEKNIQGTEIDQKFKTYLKEHGFKSTLISGQKSKGDQYSYFNEEQIKYIYELNKKWFNFFNWADEIKANLGNVINIENEKDPNFTYTEFNKPVLSDIVSGKKLDKNLTMRYTDSEIEKKLVDPISHIIKP